MESSSCSSTVRRRSLQRRSCWWLRNSPWPQKKDIDSLKLVQLQYDNRQTVLLTNNNNNNNPHGRINLYRSFHRWFQEPIQRSGHLINAITPCWTPVVNPPGQQQRLSSNEGRDFFLLGRSESISALIGRHFESF